MIDKDGISKIYNEVKENLDKSLYEIERIELKNKKGNEHVDRLRAELEVMRSNFNKEVDFLEENSEWEKFTIAFFGETNAGKSTIIESLRILMNEKQRLKQIQESKAIAEDIEKVFSDKYDALIEELNELYLDFNRQTSTISTSLESLVAYCYKENRISKKVAIYTSIGAASFVMGVLVSILIK